MQQENKEERNEKSISECCKTSAHYSSELSGMMCNQCGKRCTMIASYKETPAPQTTDSCNCSNLRNGDIVKTDKQVKCVVCGMQFQNQISTPQTPDSGILAKTIDKVLETCDEKTRMDLFSVFMKHVAMNPKNVVTPDSWENFNPLLFQDFLDETTHYHTNIKKLKDFIRTQLTLAHSSGRREGIQYATKRINEHNKDMLKMWEDFWKSLEQ